MLFNMRPYLLISFLILASPMGFFLISGASGTDETIQGRLLVRTGKKSVLHNNDGSISLTSPNDQIAGTLEDSRLTGKELKLLGTHSSPDLFEVKDMFVVRPDGLFRVIYFCETCNITTFSPANCECCQEPTVPLEVPLTDPRVHYEDVPTPPKGQLPSPK